jgi:predicted transcriptional regulator
MVPKLTLALRLARRFPDNTALLAELREDKTIRRTIDAYKFLTGVAREQRTVAVTDLAAAVKLPLSGTAQADNAKLVATILAALTNYDFEEATPLLATLVLRRAGKRPPPAFFALIDDLGMMASYDDEESFVMDETARVYKTWPA